MENKLSAEERFIEDLKVSLDRYLRDYGASSELINQAIDFQVPELLNQYAAQFKQEQSQPQQSSLSDEGIRSIIADEHYRLWCIFQREVIVNEVVELIQSFQKSALTKANERIAELEKIHETYWR